MGRKRSAKREGKNEPHMARRVREGAGKETCPVTRKVRNSSRKRALTAASTLRAHRPDIPPLRVYRCEHCGDWHFTSQTAVLSDAARKVRGASIEPPRRESR